MEVRRKRRRRQRPARKWPGPFFFAVAAAGIPPLTSPEELEASIRADPAAAAHSADFRARRARLIPAAAERFVHVSWRVGDQVFWT